MKYLNISIDDVSPHPKASTKVLSRCFELIDIFPDIKFTLFVPSAYWRTMSNTTKSPLYLYEHTAFCEEIKSLDSKNFEIGFHSHLHGIPNVSNNDEVAYISYKEAIDIFKSMLKTTERAGLNNTFKPIFRPPGWRMSKQAIKAAKDIGIEIFALGSFDYAINSYQGEDKRVNTVYETCSPPISPLKLTKHTEIVYHSCEWLNNYLDNNQTNELCDFIKKHKNEIKFCFMEEMLNG